jgi:uncharacterized HAD superfamily protein
MEPTPNKAMIERAVKLYELGNGVIIHTARHWKDASKTVAWLMKHEIPFHGLYMSKGGSDTYIDDKSIRPEELIDVSS